MINVYKNSTILNYDNIIYVVGAGGQLGQSFKNTIKDSILSYCKTKWIFFEKEDIDICNFQHLKTKFNEIGKPNIIINCAAYTNVEDAEMDKQLCKEVNIYGVSNLAQYCDEYNVTLIHFSTDYVYGNTFNSPIQENVNIEPLNMYGWSKYAGEIRLHNSKCKYFVFRISWLYSEYGKNFAKTINEKLKSGEKINVLCDQIGTPTYAGDVVNMTMKIIDHNFFKSSRQIFNFSNEGSASWYDFACAIKEYGGYKNSSVIPYSTNEYKQLAQRPSYSVMDKFKIKKYFDLEIPHWRISLKNMMKKQ